MEYEDNVKNRVKRTEGQLRGVLKMMEENKECKDIITQLSAARTAIDRTIGVLVSTNLIDCVLEEDIKEDGDTEAMIKEAVDLLVRSR